MRNRLIRNLAAALALLAIGTAGAWAVENEEKPDKPERKAVRAEKRAEKGARRSAASQPAYLDKEHGPKGRGWIALFNGQDLKDWKHFPADRPMSWKVADGILASKPKEGQAGVNLYSEKKFDDFELYYEYRVPKDGNSGVFLRGLYEIQVLDDHGVPADKPKDWGNGGIYGQQAPTKNVSKPAGEWQCVYAKIADKVVTVYLNGEKVIDNYKLTGPTYLYKELNLKEGEPGPIILQGDHKPIEYRCVMIKPAKAKK